VQPSTEDDPASLDELVLVLLDTSSSMNHDAAGMYQAPDSPDHPDSSIKQARKVCVQICGISFQRDISTVTVVPWFDRVGKPIKVKAEEFMKDDALVETYLKDLETRLSKFRACGATNIEAALLFQGEALLKQAKLKKGTIQVWLMTDGEPTYYLDKITKTSKSIPSNPKDPLFKVFFSPFFHSN
jgi:hypothetical protein